MQHFMQPMAVSMGLMQDIHSLSQNDLNQLATKEDVYNIVLEGVNAVIATINRLHLQHEKRFDQVDARLDKIEQRLDRVEQRLDKVEQRLDKVEQRLDSLEERVDQLETDIQIIKFEIKNPILKEEVAKLKKRMNYYHPAICQAFLKLLENH